MEFKNNSVFWRNSEGFPIEIPVENSEVFSGESPVGIHGRTPGDTFKAIPGLIMEFLREFLDGIPVEIPR